MFYYEKMRQPLSKLKKIEHYAKQKSLSVGVQLLSDLDCGPTWAKSVIFGILERNAYVDVRC